MSARLGLPLFQNRPPWWGPHLQTLRDTLRPGSIPDLGSTRVQTGLGLSRQGEGGSLLAWHDPPAAGNGPAARALVVVLHGLGGSSQSNGVRRLGWTLNQAGFGVLRLNMRGAGEGRSLASGFYSGRCSDDLAPALQRARELADGRPLLAVGLSLGGTVLLNSVLDGVMKLEGLALVSSPLDLAECSAAISSPSNRLYERWLLARMCRQTLSDSGALPGSLAEDLRQVDSIRAFDELITAPQWGYDDAEDYYRRASPMPRMLEASAVSCLPPMLVVQAMDDPWVPATAALSLPPGVAEVVISPGGGHNGFHAPGGCWSDQLVRRWLEQRLGSRVC